MISQEEIENLATLARLKLESGEVASLQKDVSNILEYVGQINAVESAATGPTVPSHHNVMRKDTPREAGDQLAGKEEALRKQFPTREGDYNVVRKIIQKDE
jgi:aspartyl/glutamyl-tRNA(Asn/Gln) amidotransferase C subunit